MADRTLASRYELKYWLSPQRAAEVRRLLRPFCRPDPYASVRRGHRYPISSLYLDSDGFDLYRTTIEGHHNRYKLRLRTYSDAPDTPVFLEIKKRTNQVVRKRRAAVSRELAARFLAGDQVPTVDPALEEFVAAARSLGARPVMRVRYEREAYESRSGEPVRVTLDTSLAHKPTTTADLSANGTGWEVTPTEGLILEVKFTDWAPSWVTGLIGTLGIERRSIPKYVLSLGRALERNGRTPWSRAPLNRA